MLLRRVETEYCRLTKIIYQKQTQFLCSLPQVVRRVKYSQLQETQVLQRRWFQITQLS